MKKQVLLATLVALGLAANAQEQKTIHINKTSEATYAVGGDGITPDGLVYVKNLTNDGTWLQGRYTKGARTGTWFFFDAHNKLAARYNYDQKKFLYLDTAQLHYISVRILSNDADVAKGASVPLPLCSVDYFMNLAMTQIAADHKTLDGAYKAEITAHVDDQGRPVYTVSYITNNKKSAPEKFVLKTPFGIEWAPSQYQGKTLASEFSFVADFDKAEPADTYRRFRWDN